MTRALIVVDTQFDFQRERYMEDGERVDGKLPVPAEHVEENYREMLEYARENDIAIIYTQDWHTPDNDEIVMPGDDEEPDGKNTFPPHCMAGTKGAEHVPAAAPSDDAYVVSWQDDAVDWEKVRRSDEIVVRKKKFDMWKEDANPYTDQVIDEKEIDAAVYIGVTEEICVNDGIVGGRARGMDVYAATPAMEALGGEDLPDEEKVLQNWRDCGALVGGLEGAKVFLDKGADAARAFLADQ